MLQDQGIQNVCPADLRRLPSIPVTSAEEVRAAVVRARAAQAEWEALGLRRRARLMRRATREMLVRRQEILELLYNEVGKTPAEALLSEAVGPLQYVKDWTRVVRPCLKPQRLAIPALAFPKKRGVIERIPRGVVGIISPWNYPLGNFFKPVFPALLCGNTVVIKPSEFSPRSAKWFVDVMSEFLPRDVLIQVPGGPETGRALVESGIDAVTFTGSFASGREVARMAAEQMIPCSVELGGKDAAIILADCELDRTVAGILQWSLHNAGHACGNIERVYVEAAIADVFVARLARAASSLRVGSGDPQRSDLGPVAHEKQLRVVEEHVQEAVARGAMVRCGGKRAGVGLWYEPTVLDHCDPSMKVMREPTFGPVIPIMRVRSADEAIRLANDCEYGLNASIWSSELGRAEKLARKLQVGTAFVNNHGFTGALASAPWTGVKKSGYGVANSVFALNHYTRPRTVVIDRKRSTDAYWYPLDAVAEELGHRLAEAQLGRIFSALKLPFLIARRERATMKFIRGEAKAIERSMAAPRREPWWVAGLRWALGLVGRLAPPLTSKEVAWGIAAMKAIYGTEGTEKKFALLSDSEAAVFLKDFYQHFRFPMTVSLRLSFWVAGLSPLFTLGRWRTLDRLSPEERVAAVRALARHDSFLLRQMALLLKMSGALSHAGTRRFQEALSLSPAGGLPKVDA